MRRYGTILSLQGLCGLPGWRMNVNVNVQDEEVRDHSFFAVVLTQFGTFVEFRLRLAHGVSQKSACIEACRA